MKRVIQRGRRRCRRSSADPKSATPAQTIAYGTVGNRVEVTDNGVTTKYQSNEANQYIRIEPGTEIVEPQFDKLGNLLHDDRNTYTWDADIHLLSVTTQPSSTTANNPQPSSTTSFRYDALHRRVARIEQGIAGALPASGGAPPPSATTFFVMDGWNVIAEYGGATFQVGKSGATFQVAHASDRQAGSLPHLAARHVWGEDLSGTLQGAGGIGGLLASTHYPQRSPTTANKRQPPPTHFLSYDSNGNVILLTDRAGIPSAKYRYDAFGKTISATGPMAQVNSYQFSTKPTERGSGLAYYGFRYYDPVNGRWPNRDPLGELGGPLTYVAHDNDAVNVYDPDERLVVGGSAAEQM